MFRSVSLDRQPARLRSVRGLVEHTREGAGGAGPTSGQRSPCRGGPERAALVLRFRLLQPVDHPLALAP